MQNCMELDLGNREMEDIHLYNIHDTIMYLLHSRYYTFGYLHDDMYNAAYLGYLKAQKNYNPEFGDMSLEYVSQYMRAEIQQLIQKELKHPNTSNSESPTQDPYLTGEDIEEEDQANIDEAIWVLENIKRVRKQIKKLPEREKDIITSRWLIKETATLDDLSKKYNISKERVRQLEAQAMKRIWKQLKEEGYTDDDV